MRIPSQLNFLFDQTGFLFFELKTMDASSKIEVFLCCEPSACFPVCWVPSGNACVLECVQSSEGKNQRKKGAAKEEKGLYHSTSRIGQKFQYRRM